ncbi:MAG: hypothetical protein WBV53_02920, partial [Solirubrobacterales bacterium]
MLLDRDELDFFFVPERELDDFVFDPERAAGFFAFERLVVVGPLERELLFAGADAGRGDGTASG